MATAFDAYDSTKFHHQRRSESVLFDRVKEYSSNGLDIIRKQLSFFIL